MIRLLRLAVFVILLCCVTACQSAGNEQAVTEPVATAVVSIPEPTLTQPPPPTATATTVPPTPTDTSVPATATPTPRLFTFYGDDPAVPVVARGTSGTWDSKYVNPGAIIFHDGLFHMFRNGFLVWPGLVSIGYMQSEDGYTWTSVQDEPVFTSNQVPYVLPGQGADVSSVVVLDDGTWVMFFHLVSNSQPGVIGRATAPTPTGPWTPDPEPILTPGETGSWDDRGLMWPNVLYTPEGYFMYYGARQLAKETMIGLATSVDGITWTKYDDPTTTEPPFASSDPVLRPHEGWSEGDVDRGRVVYTDEGFVMIFQGGTLIKRGLAFSDDGIHWTEHPENPVITHEDFPINGSTWDTSLVYHNNIYFYFMEIGDMGGTDIYLATHEGRLRP